MFLKPYKVKSNTPMKGSDSRKIRQRVEQSFLNLSPEDILQLFPPKSNISMQKLVTHSDNLTVVYCVDRLPMFFIVENGPLVPTLYALWRVPNMLPYFTTVPGVLPKLSNGADLMLPGVVPQGTGMNIYGHYKKNELVAVNLTSNKSAVGVGLLPRSSDDLYMSGGRGVAVNMLHIFGDKLWSHEPTLAQQVPISEPSPNLKEEEFPSLGTEVKNKQNLKKELNEKTEDSSFASAVKNESNVPSLINLTITQENDAVEDNEEIKELSPDTILRNAFLAALKNHGKTLQLPILTSHFYRQYLLPEALTQIDLKKTKYKKFSNFINEMIEEGFIVVREEPKGVDKITSIDLEHTELVNFITDYKKANALDAENQEQPLFHSELIEMYTVTDETAHFFTKMDYKRGESIPSAQIKKIVKEYISKYNLPIFDPATKSIKLDECLANICECADAPLNKISNCVLNKMTRSYQMCSVKDTSANKPFIQISLGTRSGNKKVTLVSNVESYGIIIPELIKLCKQGAAASTTIVKLPNQKREQIQIQGNQVRFVYNLLTETYKVPKKCILGLELAKEGKKRKKN